MPLNGTDLFLVNRDDKNYKQSKEDLMAKLEDADYLLVNRDDKTYKITGAEFKGSFDGKVVTAPSITSSSEYPTSTLTATQAIVENATKDVSYPNWYKNEVAIAGTANQLVYTATESGTYKYKERWVDGGSNELFPSAEITVSKPKVAKPTVIAPADGSGVGGDTTYFPMTSAATVGSTAYTKAAVFWAKNTSGSCIYATEYNGSIYSVGSGGTSGGDKDLYIIKHNGTTGEVIQTKTFNFGSGFTPKAALLLNGYIYTTGMASSLQLLKIDVGTLTLATSVSLNANNPSTEVRTIKPALNGVDILLAGNTVPSGQNKNHCYWQILTPDLENVASTAHTRNGTYDQELNAAIETEDYIIGVGRAYSTNTGNYNLVTYRYNKSGSYDSGQLHYFDQSDHGAFYDIATNNTDTYAIGVNRGRNNAANCVVFAQLNSNSHTLKERWFIDDGGNAWGSGGVAVDEEGNGYFKRIQENGNTATITKIDPDFNIVWHYAYSRTDANEDDQNFASRMNFAGDKLFTTCELNDSNNPKWAYTWNALPHTGLGDLPATFGPLTSFTASTPTLTNSALTGQGISATNDNVFSNTIGNGTVVNDGTTSLLSDINQVDQAGSYPVLNLADNKVYDSSTSAEVSATLNVAFAEGTEVKAKGGTPAPDSAAMATYKYNGTSAQQFLPTGIDNTGKSLIWLKNRDRGGYYHFLVDSINKKYIQSNSKNGGTDAIPNTIVSFDAGGVTLGSNSGPNNDNDQHIAWNFRGAPNFFDVVNYKGKGSVLTVPHDLESAPGAIIVKDLDGSSNWYVYHKSIGSGSWLQLNNNEGKQTTNTIFANTDPTADNFTIGTATAVNTIGNNYVAYLFGDTTGKIKCDHYIGRGNSGNVSVDCGFDVEWLLIKKTDSSGVWVLFDATRGLSNASNGYMQPSSDAAESFPPSGGIRAQANGFIASGSVSEGDWNSKDGHYAYIAIAKNVQANEFPPTAVVEEVDSNAPSLTLKNVNGDWQDGMKAVSRDQLTETAPNPDTLQFVGSIPAASQGTINTWANATWTVTKQNDSTEQTATIAIIPDQLQKFSVGNNITLEGSTMYDVTVKYEAADAVPATSDANEFLTAAGRPDGIGAEFGGGFYAGQITDDGVLYDLIVAPKSENGLDGEARLAYKTSRTTDSGTAVLNDTYGGDATAQFANNSTYPVFEWCTSNASGPNGGAFDQNGNTPNGAGIGGYTDWYIPAKYELELLYRNFKPHNNNNDTSSGYNPDSVPMGATYTQQNPSQTTSPTFVSGQANAFTDDQYGCSSQDGTSASHLFAIFNTGQQNGGGDKDFNRYYRAVRRQQYLGRTVYFYDTNKSERIIGQHIVEQYGVEPTSAAAKNLGFAELTEQVTYPVAGYELQSDGRYKPIRSYDQEIAELTAELAAAQAVIDSFESP